MAKAKAKASKMLAKGVKPKVVITVQFGNAKATSFQAEVTESKSYWTATPKDSSTLCGFGKIYVKPHKSGKSSK